MTGEATLVLGLQRHTKWKPLYNFHSTMYTVRDILIWEEKERKVSEED